MNFNEFSQLDENGIAKMILKYGQNSIRPHQLFEDDFSDIKVAKIASVYITNKKAALELVDFDLLSSHTLYALFEVDNDGEFLTKIRKIPSTSLIGLITKLRNIIDPPVSLKGFKKLEKLVSNINNSDVFISNTMHYDLLMIRTGIREE